MKRLHAVARRFLPALARHAPLLPGADQVAYVDIDDTIRRTYGYAKQGAGYGYSKVKGLNALLGIASTLLAAPVIAATRLRKGPSNSARGAAAFVAETIRTARACGASGLLVMRADSAFYGADVVNSCRALGARFSITVRMNASIKAAIARIDENAWTPIKYPKAVWDEEGQCWRCHVVVGVGAWRRVRARWCWVPGLGQAVVDWLATPVIWSQMVKRMVI
ncbi:transposase [Streptomyces sp. NPDC056653]|uniref:transposase n=1 Tax=Streptomyces sp. NPDC056653 TaxID=3345894 RepID=UPI0036A854FC